MFITITVSLSTSMTKVEVLSTAPTVVPTGLIDGSFSQMKSCQKCPFHHHLLFPLILSDTLVMLRYGEKTPCHCDKS